MPNTPIETFGAPEVFADGVHDIKIIENVARIPWYSRRDGESVVVLHLAVPVSELPEVIQALVVALAEMVRNATKAISH